MSPGVDGAPGVRFPSPLITGIGGHLTIRGERVFITQPGRFGLLVLRLRDPASAV